MYLLKTTYLLCSIFAAHQWLQFDIGPPTLVTGLITKGRGDTGKKNWVTRYRLSYSNDSQIWYYYKDASHLDPKVCNRSIRVNRFNKVKGNGWRLSLVVISALTSINVVNRHWDRLLIGWVTAHGQVNCAKQ